MTQDQLPVGVPERRVYRPSPILLLAAFLGFAGITFATLCPIGMRPHFASANVERFGAYFVLGGIFSFAFPRRRLTVVLGVLTLACGLEAAQLLIPGRDGRFEDATVKAFGGVMGACAGYAIYPLKRLGKALRAKILMSSTRFGLVQRWF